MANITITPTDLQQSAHKYRDELLIMPVIAADATLQHMSGRPGVAGRETVGQLSGTVELAPHDPLRNDANDLTISGRTLETYLGSVVKRFDLNDAGKSVYGPLLRTQGDSLTQEDLAKSVLEYVAAQIGSKLNMAIFSGERDASGTTTQALFDGFDTITATEITAGTISAANGNLKDLSATTITDNNAFDVLSSFYADAADELQGQATKLFVSYDIYRHYCRSFLTTFGAAPYNTEYKKTFLEGSDGLCELVPLASKKNSPYIHLSTQGNMLYGYGNGMERENVEIMQYHEFLTSFVCSMYFGVQFESISPARLLVGQLVSETVEEPTQQ